VQGATSRKGTEREKRGKGEGRQVGVLRAPKKKRLHFVCKVYICTLRWPSQKQQCSVPFFVYQSLRSSFPISLTLKF
jgi:hypothetical protein